MGRQFAGILGTLAFAAYVFQGLLVGHSLESTLKIACLALAAFTAVGFVCGLLGDWFVTESVRAKVNAELAALDAAESVRKS